MEDIGLEDYFLLFELHSNKTGLANPGRFCARGVLRRMLLDAIYNGGAIEGVHHKFPSGTVQFIRDCERVFTTNYDGNLESASGREVIHLHGAFAVLDEVYDPTSYRREAVPDLLDGEKVDMAYPHLYSNCLMAHASNLKEAAILESGCANTGLAKFADAYNNRDPSARAWVDSPESDPIVRRLKTAIKMKAANPALEHAQQYRTGELRALKGTLTVVGLSSSNDGHLFEDIANSPGLTSIEYYWFDRAEGTEAVKLLPGKHVSCYDVRDLWARLDRI